MEKARKYRKYKRSLLTLATIFAIIGIGTCFNVFLPAKSNTEVGDGIDHDGAFCIQVNDGPMECSHNIITNAGKDYVLALLKGETSGAVKYIAIGNGTAPAAGDTTLDGEQTTDGLARAEGTIDTTGSSGSYNVSVNKVFTYTGSSDRVVNTTALFNASSGGTFFIGDSFSSRTLKQNDKINITAYFWHS